MNKIIGLIIFSMALVFSGQIFSQSIINNNDRSTPNNCSSKPLNLIKLAGLKGACPKGCNSCWDQCTKNSDCGTGHKCIRAACGSRCVSK